MAKGDRREVGMTPGAWNVGDVCIFGDGKRMKIIAVTEGEYNWAATVEELDPIPVGHMEADRIVEHILHTRDGSWEVPEAPKDGG